MCGIVGVIEKSGGLTEALVRGMAEQIRYRGPDSSGEAVLADGRVAFAHRRLSILDLSPAGHQPMVSSSGRYTITFNGEVFNYREIAQELTTPIRGESDTAVMLACFEEFGVREAVSRFVGMFAFAVWDAVEGTVTLVRDRLGVKPLYYGEVNGSFVFTSDLQALRVFPGFAREVDRDALALYFQYGYVPGPWSIVRGLKKLPPGHFLSLSCERSASEVLLESAPEPYWNAPSSDVEATLTAPAHSRRWREEFDEKAFLDDLDERLSHAVRLRLVADVPLGAFLSGGIDSSLVVALMQRYSATPVKTFSIGFEEASFNEAPFARAVADHLRTEHTELIVTDTMSREVIPLLSQISDEPFGDASLIPTYLVSKLARQAVTVSLSGDGGDELFGGYNRYALLASLMTTRDAFPGWMISLANKGAQYAPLGMMDSVQRLLQRVGVFPFALNNPGEKVRRVLALVSERDPQELYYKAVRHFRDGAGVVAGMTIVPEVARVWATHDPKRMMAAADIRHYLPDDILTKVDRASMAVSLEAREPLLDHRLVEYAGTLPMEILYRDGKGKWPLRALLSRYIPQQLIDRPKSGFNIPLDAWLRGSLRGWAEGLLTQEALESQGLRAEPIRTLWKEHIHGGRNHAQLLWNVLMYQDWVSHK